MSGRRRLSGSELHSYGGDAKILATRVEIDRVIAELNALEGWLRSQIELPDFAIDPVLRVRLALELPPILEKLNQIRDACGLAADSYFGAEAEISREPAPPGPSASGQVSVPEARYVVYIPGTQSWTPRPGTNPFDLTSNLSAISKTGFAGSERAVALAMTQAGIGHDSKVLLVGHSQGGMVAANISTRFAGSKVLTFGSPLGQLSGKLTATTMSVEHERDPVPKLDSQPNPLAINWVTVRQELAGIDPIAQHEMAGYLSTALAIDAQPAEEGLDRIRQQIVGFAGETAGQAYFFELKREP